ncbi:efflux RND transporter periplasmic adaptor subunit [Cognatiyoonia sp. IB215446]|uniref:efflux RND transporter periplasmic adaptor subunit n=1 Tax=Cognatiyoonia sp. IB215446 TaxID=3097355 RepID=UPI002A120A85|nr:efflux RND transporter periplasmic adaptor subunit [Cognatiyoonia sp. IB215446]MDX8347507.1 efflux RND transporter periplasmic adaptor subunit [Cognatiyoonia sp. IB215446]
MNLKPLLILPPLILGVAGYIWMTQPDATAAQPVEEAKLAVRVMTVEPSAHVVSATGFGRVEAVRSWSAISQVDGRVTQTHTDLSVGTVVDAGALLIQVDKTDYELAIQKSEANIAAAEAQLAELDGQEENSQNLLALEQRSLEVAQAEFDRNQNLFDSGTASAATLDAAQKTLLAQENAVTNLTNTIALYPAQRQSAEATLAVREAELAEAERGLSNTTITAPFRGRVSAEMVQVGQFIRTGEQLVTIDAIDTAEVVGAFQPQAFASVVSAAFDGRNPDVTEVDATQVIEIMKRGDIKAYVALEFAGVQARYPAQLARFRGTIDSETGTIGLAVRIDDPLVVDTNGGRPPLEFGAFVGVVLEGTTPAEAIAVPRTAIRQGDDGAPFVYTATADDRLAITPIILGPVAGDMILVQDGLAAGDRVILSAPRPPIERLSLTPIEDTGVTQ